MARVKHIVDLLQDQPTAKLIKRQAYYEEQFYNSFLEEMQDTSYRPELQKDP